MWNNKSDAYNLKISWLRSLILGGVCLDLHPKVPFSVAWKYILVQRTLLDFQMVPPRSQKTDFGLSQLNLLNMVLVVCRHAQTYLCIKFVIKCLQILLHYHNRGRHHHNKSWKQNCCSPRTKWYLFIINCCEHLLNLWYLLLL